MTTDDKEIRRKLRVLEHAQDSGNIGKTCRDTSYTDGLNFSQSPVLRKSHSLLSGFLMSNVFI